jgi:carbon-monoxide dehydrogenase medium subunit
MAPFAYRRPRTSAELFDLLEQHGTDAALLAGGTDLVVGLRMGKRTASVVVDVKGVDAVDGAVVRDGDRLTVGATATMTTLVDHPDVQRHLPVLVEAASIVGSVQIRNRATLVGNVCNASPAADTVPALLVHDTEVVLLSREGPRQVPLRDFLVGPGRTAMRAGEIVTSLTLRLPQRPTGTAFARVTRRLGVDLATINLCCAVDDRVTRLVLGAVGPRALVVQDDSGLLADPAADPDARGRLLDDLLATATPISDVRAGADYRRAMLRVHARRALASAIDRRDGAGAR